MDTAIALALFARTTVLFRVKGRAAVARVSRESMRGRATTRAELEASGVDVWRGVRAIWRAKRLWPSRTMCLETALVAHWFFGRKGIHAPLHLGVQKADETLKAHAWVRIGDYEVDLSGVYPEYLPFAGEGRGVALEGDVTA
ncbi:MAG: lasso peptide biosynthesis B2 protein [Hyphomicrobiales bacterium]